jgi:hypothetical protein
MTDSLLASREKKKNRLRWTLALKRNVGKYMKDKINQELVSNAGKLGYGYSSIISIKDDWTAADSPRKRKEIGEKFTKMVTTGFFQGKWKYKAEEEYMKMKKIRYIKKDRDNDYNGCVAKQATRAMGDVTKRINSGAAPRIGGHGWKFSLKGRNKSNKNIFNPVVPFEKKKETRRLPMRTQKRTRETLLRMAEDCLSKKRARSGILSKKKMNVGDREDPDDGGYEDSDGGDGGAEEDPPPGEARDFSVDRGGGIKMGGYKISKTTKLGEVSGWEGLEVSFLLFLILEIFCTFTLRSQQMC